MEHCLPLDCARFRVADLPCRLDYSNGALAHLELARVGDGIGVRAAALWDSRSTVTFAPLLQSSPLYGGVRFWLGCPDCGRRSRVLWLPPWRQGFACRHCHRLTYLSRRLKPFGRAVLRRDRMLASGHPALGSMENLVWGAFVNGVAAHV